MRLAVMAVAMLALPVCAFAQQRTVPPLTGADARVAVPPGMPPAIRPLSPSAPLIAKEQAAARMAAAWRNRNNKPTRGPDGELLWPFGLSLPSVVCSPLQVCDVALKPGEVVNNINLGDKVRWSVTPALSGVGAERTTHLVIKPQDAGLVTSMLVYTDERTYSIKLISTQHAWTPLTAFSYPEDQQQAWANYRAAMPAARSMTGGGSVDAEHLMFYRITGDDPSWRPLRAYSDGERTYIQFPHAISYGRAPVLVGLANDGGLFSSPSEQMVNYSVQGNTYVVDGVLDRAELVLGVGGSATKVRLVRQR